MDTDKHRLKSIIKKIERIELHKIKDLPQRAQRSTEKR
jgi:hypothetical protein